MFEEIRDAVLGVIARVDEETIHHRQRIQDMMDAIGGMQTGLNKMVKKVRVHIYALYGISVGIIAWIIWWGE